MSSVLQPQRSSFSALIFVIYVSQEKVMRKPVQCTLQLRIRAVVVAHRQQPALWYGCRMPKTHKAMSCAPPVSVHS